MIGHLGSRVSALLDGRLSADEEEAAWEHVHSCHPCRDLVEHEGWVKTRLASLSSHPCGPSDSLKLNLLLATCAEPADPVRHESFASRHRGMVVLGSSAAGVAFLGVAVLSALPNSAPVLDRRAPTVSSVNPAAPVRTPQQVVPGHQLVRLGAADAVAVASVPGVRGKMVR